MTIWRLVGCVGLAGCILAGGANTVRAEISADPGPAQSAGTTQLGIIEGPDPIDPLGWQAYRQIPPEQILNSAGAARGDGRPDIAWYPSNGWPIVVWAWNAGTDHDIAFSEWNGSTWTTPTFLTSTPSDDVDPRVLVETDGTVHVTWWSEETPSVVQVVTRPAGSGWQAPVQVTGTTESGRRPSVALFDGALRVSYERNTTYYGMTQEIVVSKQQVDGTFAPEIVARTSRAERLDVVLHFENGHFWADWKDDGGLFGYVEDGTGGWGSPASHAWTDTSWIGVEDVRRSIRRQVMAP